MIVLLRYMLIGACLLLSGLASWHSSKLAEENAQTQFRSLTKDAQEVFRRRLDSYVRSLDSAAAYVASSPNLTSRDWANFVELIDIEKTLPGVVALSVVRSVQEADLASFVAQRRNDNQPDFRVHPVIQTDDHLIIEFIEPRNANKDALGLDLKFDQVRVEAMEASRVTGERVLSPPVPLVQNPDTPGYVFSRPAFSYESADSTKDNTFARRQIFHGWVVAPFFSMVTLANLTADQESRFNLEVYDQTGNAEPVLIYDRLEGGNNTHGPRFSVTLNEPFLNRNWSMHFSSTRAFEASVDSYEPIIVFITGLSLTALLGLLIDILARRVATVDRLVESRTRQLKARVDENKSIIESAFLPILMLNDDNQIINANPAALSLTGASDLSELKGRAITDFAVPVTRPDLSASLAFGGWTHRGADGRLLNIHQNTWRDASDKPRHSLLVRDVTEEARAALRITEAEQRWYLALNGADIGVFDINLETGKSVVSETWRRLMQVENEGADYDAQADFLSRIHKDDLPRLVQSDRDCIEGKTDRSICEYRLIGRDGSWRWMRSDAAIVERHPDGRAVRLIGAQMDVTELRNARAAVEASQKRFQLVLSEAPVGMAVLDSEGVFVSANSAICTLLGYPEDQLVGNIRLGQLLNREALNTIITAIGPNAQDRPHAYHGDHEFIARDGTLIWGLLSIAWTYDSEMQSDIYIAQINDITEKKNIEKLKSEFVATVSHELRTPLTSIKGSLSLLQTSSQGLKEPVNRLLDIAQRNTNRLISIVNDILDLEKISSGQASFVIGANPLKEIIEDAVSEIGSYADEKGVVLKMDLPDDPMLAQIDPARTHQVLTNLLSNACKFSYRGGEVSIRAERLPDQFIVYVCDNGRGVPDSFKSKIFTPFLQADNSDTREHNGTGLGLNITRRIVEFMGGRVGFSSEANKLTVFWFTIPFAQPEKTDPL